VPRATSSKGGGGSRGRLDQDELVATVLRMTHEVGLDGLTMRGLAAELGVTPMAAYHWVPSKQALVELTLEAVLAEIAAVEHTGTWDERLRSMAFTYRDIVASYPGVGPALIDHPVTEVARGGIARGLDILRDGGFVEPELGWAWGLYQSFMLGHASLEAQRARKGGPRKRDDLSRLRYDAAGPDAFAWGVDRLLDGLRAAAPKR
jgi:AcrR family transcriptional regulator